LDEVLSDLKVSEREALVLRFLSGHSIEEFQKDFGQRRGKPAFYSIARWLPRVLLF